MKNLKLYRPVSLWIIMFVLTGNTVWAQMPELVIQNGHNAEISGLATHPFNNQMASVDANGKVVIWDMDTRMILRKLEVENSYFPGRRQNLKFSGGGENIYFSSHNPDEAKIQPGNTAMTVTRIADGTVLNRNEQEVDFAFDADSSLLLTVNEYSEYKNSSAFIRSWLIKQGQDSTRRAQTISFQEKITNIVVSAEKNTLLLGFYDGTLKAFNTNNLTLSWQASDFPGPVSSVDVSDNSRWVVYTGKSNQYGVGDGHDTLVVRSVDDGRLIKKLDVNPRVGGPDAKGFRKAQFAPGSNYLAAISGYKLMIWDAETFDLIYNGLPNLNFNIFDGVHNITDMAFTNNGSSLVLASGSNLFSFDVSTQSYSGFFNHGMSESYNFDAIGILDERRYYLYAKNDQQLETVDLSNFENEIHGPAIISGLMAKAARIDTSLQSLSHLYAPHPGNVLTFMPNREHVVMWATPPGQARYYEENYFLQFDMKDWSFQRAYGPFSWEEAEFDTFHRLMYLNSNDGWYALRGNIIYGSYSTGGISRDVIIRSLETNEKLLETHILENPGLQFSPSGKYVATVDSALTVVVYKTDSLEEIYRKPLKTPAGFVSPVFSSDTELMIAESDSALATTVTKVQLNPLSETAYWSFKGNVPTAMAATDRYLALGVNYDYSLNKWQDSVDVKFKKFGTSYFTDPNVLVIDHTRSDQEVVAHIKGIADQTAHISLNNNFILIKPIGRPLQVAPLSNPGYHITHYKMDGFNIFADSSYYSAPKEALWGIGLRVEDHAFPVENFDLRFNRPDVLMEAMGLSTKEEIALYNRAYQKRMERNDPVMGTAKKFNLKKFPDLQVINKSEIPASTTDSTVNFLVAMEDENFGLASWNISVNGVLQFGSSGELISTDGGESMEAKVAVPLLEGENRIKFTAVNQAGVQSIPVQRVITRETENPSKPDVYIVTIGVSDYAQDAYDLQYAAKDAGDIQKLFSPVDTLSFGTFEKFNFPKGYYGDIHRFSLTNEEVSRSKVMELGNSLMKTKPGDMVLVFLAGHGMLDAQGTYYFAGHDMDFGNPGKYGISFDDIQGLFDGIPARRRVLFMDTCQSGELDTTVAANQPDSTSTVHTYGDTRIVTNMQRGVSTLSSGDETSRKDEFMLMKELFADFNSTGTVIISAASGTGYALENDTWQNGVFTYAIIQGLGENKADKDGNAEISVSELRDYILDEVEILTEGRQTPTTRQENVENDFRIW